MSMDSVAAAGDPAGVKGAVATTEIELVERHAAILDVRVDAAVFDGVPTALHRHEARFRRPFRTPAHRGFVARGRSRYATVDHRGRSTAQGCRAGAMQDRHFKHARGAVGDKRQVVPPDQRRQDDIRRPPRVDRNSP